MNKQRFLALALAGVLALSLLAACTANNTEPQVDDDILLEDDTTLEEDDTTLEEDDTTLEEDDTTLDDDIFLDPNVGTDPNEGDLDMDVPTLDDESQNDSTVVTPPATTTPVVPEPEPTVTPTPDVDAMSKVEAVWTDIEALGEMPLFGDAEGDILVSFYGVDLSHLEEVICKVPMINVTATEFFIAKVTSGNMDAVEAAVLSRQANLVADWSNYLPEQLDLVNDYQLVINGDYIFFGIGYNVDEAVDIFNSYTK